MGLLFTAALTITGCSNEETEPKNKAEKQAGQSEQTISFKDALNNEIIIEDKPGKIVSLIPSNTEIVYSLGLGEAVVGVSDFDNYPEDTLSKEKIGGIEFNVEKILSLAPDLVLAHESTAKSAKEGFKQLEDSGIQVVVVNDARSFQSLYQSIEMIGKATAAEDEAKKLITNMESKLAMIEEKTAEVAEDERKSVFIEVSPAPEMYTTGKDTFMDEMLQTIHAVNAAGEKAGWIMVDQEAILQENPDVIITTYGAYTENAIDQVLGREGWQDVKAIKNKQVVDLDPDLVTRSGPRMIEGVEELAKAVYPDIFDKK